MAEKQLDWIPIYIDKILGSPRWAAMRDYERGWYFNLLLNAVRSERPGFLRLDSNLWTIAGANRRDFFEHHKSRVMACFKVREMEGQTWIFNERLLLTLEEQHEKIKKRPKRSYSYSLSDSDVDLGKKPSNEGFDGAEWFRKIIREHPRPERGHEAQVAVMESILWVLGQGIRETRLAAAEYVLERTKLYKQCTRNWPDKSKITGAARWYRGQMFEQDAEIWGAEKQEQCLKHPQSGLTPNGGCFACYAEAHG